MNYRTLGRPWGNLGHRPWHVGLAGWSGADDHESERARLCRGSWRQLFDTARAYGEGKSERMLGRLLQRHRSKKLYVATKIPPKNLRWTGLAGIPLDVFPPIAFSRLHLSQPRKTCGLDTIDLQQLHARSDEWADDALAAGRVRPQAEGGDSRDRHQRQSLGTRQRCARSRPDYRRGASRLPTFSIRRRKTSCFPLPAHQIGVIARAV